MSQTNKTLKNIGRVLVFLIAIIILFFWYTRQNSKRIENQNLNYAADSAEQMAAHIENEFNNAQNRINTYAYFLSESLSEPTVSVGALGDMSEKSLFDDFRFTNAEGMSISANGQTFDASDRDYYLSGMQGESGVSVIFKSRTTGDTVSSFP